jgi:glutamyl-tRNA reductase
MARTVFASFEQRTALLIGAGDTIAIAARHLHGDGLGRMIVANRSVEHARELASEFHGFAIGLDSVTAHLHEADLVICSTASPTPLVTRAMTADALRVRRRKPMFMLDLAVPRDIEPAVAELEDVYLFTIDDLQGVVDRNLAGRREAARAADQLIATEVDRFELSLRTRDAAPAIRRLRDDADSIRRQTIEQAQRMLASGREPQAVLEFLAETLTNRLMHPPSQRLRDAAERGDAALIEAIVDIYRLDRDP